MNGDSKTCSCGPSDAQGDDDPTCPVHGCTCSSVAAHILSPCAWGRPREGTPAFDAMAFAETMRAAAKLMVDVAEILGRVEVTASEALLLDAAEKYVAAAGKLVESATARIAERMGRGVLK